jgi:hypothetical protein
MRIVLLVLFATVSAAAQPAPPPPSTGHELAPTGAPISAEVQADLVRKVIRVRECKGHVAAFSAAISAAGAKLTVDERLAANALLQQCARAEKAWTALLHASVNLLVLAPDKANPQDIIQAYLGMNDEAHAVAALQLLGKQYPKQRAELTGAVSLIVCHTNDFKKCRDASGKMMALLAKQPTHPFEAELDNLVFHAAAAAALGDYRTYETDVHAAEELGKANKVDLEKGLAPFKTRVEQARAAQLFVDWDAAKELPLGTYHLMAGGKLKEAGDLLVLRFVNQAKKQRDIT